MSRTDLRITPIIPQTEETERLKDEKTAQSNE
jgi:hypothetical protein